MALMSQTRPETLLGAVSPVPESKAMSIALQAGLVLVASLLIVLSAKVSVPFWPVPMTMQSFAVIALGAALGPRLGVAAVALYISHGLLGMPVFANTPPAFAGPAYLLGPTGGFILGFLPAAAIAGWSAARGASMARVIIGLALTHVVILGLGFLWLGLGAQLANNVTGMGLEMAFAKGVLPFVLGSIVKVALAATLVFAGWNWLAKRG